MARKQKKMQSNSIVIPDIHHAAGRRSPMCVLRWCGEYGWLILPPLLVFWVTILGPWWSLYQINVDEGFNLMKGALVAKGFRLYAEIWSDQPPLFSYILAVKELIWPGDVGLARGIILIFSCLLLAALFRIIKVYEGAAAAWFGVFLLASGWIYGSLSVAVMIGLPALAVATFSLERLIDKASPGRTVVSGILFGLALNIKYFVFPVALGAALLIMFPEKQNEEAGTFRIRRLLMWFGSAFTIFASIALVTKQPILDQLISPHLAVSRTETTPFGSVGPLFAYLSTWPSIIPGAVLGFICTVIWHRRCRVVPAALTVVALTILANHTPLWNHHALLPAIPMAWLASVGFTEAVGYASTAKSSAWLRLAAGIVVIGLLAGSVPNADVMIKMFQASQKERFDAVEALRKQQGARPWLVTDVLIDAYYLGSLVPPNLAVYSKKRLDSGNLPAAMIISEIERWKPAQIMFRRPNMAIHPEVMAYLKQHYQFMPDKRWTHFVSRGE